MKITIEYCIEWNYKSRALSLRDSLLKAFPDSEIELIKSAGGAFEVVLYDTYQNIFSKLKSGRFPDSEEIIKAIKECRATRIEGSYIGLDR